ncbi:hypothetical protein ACSBR2_019558 [Camellia fascicularis]
MERVRLIHASQTGARYTKPTKRPAQESNGEREVPQRTLRREAINLRGVRPQVEQLQAQLNRMQCFLEAADARPKGGADEIIIHNCVAEIREAAYDVEAAIATFVIKVLHFTVVGDQVSSLLFSRGVGESSSSTSTAERQRQLRRSYTHIVEEDVVSTEEDVKAVVDLLAKEKTHYRVVSIWGMGGPPLLRCLSPGFPNTTEVGSKILLTTRNENVAKHVDQQRVLYKWRHLTEKESWELFQKTFLRRKEGFTLSTEMIELGKAMVKPCGGVPLAIVVLGGLLTTKDKLVERKEVSKNISYDLGKGKSQGGIPITDILALSYQGLPYHLKACFLYLSHLPEDYVIHAKKLIQMWMAKALCCCHRYQHE